MGCYQDGADVCGTSRVDPGLPKCGGLWSVRIFLSITDAKAEVPKVGPAQVLQEHLGAGVSPHRYQKHLEADMSITDPGNNL